MHALIMIVLLITLICFLITYRLYTWINRNVGYWKERNVPHVKPKLFFGNYMDYILLRKSITHVTNEICKQFPDAPYFGVFYGTEPALVVKDPELIKVVLAKDFYYFNGRENTDYAHCETITRNIFLNGGDHWRVCRQNLTPIFTSAKLKMMFPLIKDCAKKFEELTAHEVKISQTVDVKLLMIRYTMECFINCAFGVSANALEKSEGINTFMIIGEKIFVPSIRGSMKLVARSIWPSIFYGLGFKVFDDDIVSFFRNLFYDITNKRTAQKSSRNDFIDFISNWKNEAYITGDSISNMKTNEKKIVKIEANDELLLAQCILFFGAGFETTASTIGFLLFELAKHKAIQDRVIEEIDDYLKIHDGDVQHESYNELPFTEACLTETMRLYPILGVMTREVRDDYTMPSGLCLKRGDRVHIPIDHLHKNPKYFEDPEEFRPERFLGDEKKNIQPFTFLPFGEGPRICIGSRFAKMTIYPCLMGLFKNYRVELGTSMPQKLQFRPASFVTQTTTDLLFNFIPRH